MKKVSVHCSHIGHNFGTKELFADITTSIHPGDKVVIVGDNGSGKSTLLKIIAKKLIPTEGVVQYSGFAGILTQDIEAEKQETIESYTKRSLPDREDRQIAIALDEVSLDASPETRVDALSGGQQTKLRLAVLVAQDVDILLLDEPTNHLDTQHVERLVKRVKNYKGPVICVSHDRAFIDEIATQIFDIRFGRLEVYAGNYSKYMDERQLRMEKQLQEYSLHQRKKEQMEKRLADLRQRATVHVNPARGKLLRSKEKHYERTFVRNAVEKPKKDVVMQMGMAGGKHRRKRVLQLAAQMIGYEDRCLFTMPEVTLRGKDKILLQGPNGSGKSTLLKTLWYSWEREDREMKSLGYITEPSEYITRGPEIRCMYLDQHNIATTSEEQVYKRCEKNFPEHRDESHIRSKLVNAGIPTGDMVRKLSELSYGQRIKIRFLQVMAHAYDLIFLDEPTNHLDISTREVLEEMLQKYEGAFILVSHDRWFAQQIGVTQLREIEGKELIVGEDV